MSETFNCHLVLLENCLLKCKMCHMWECKNDPEEMPAEAWMDLLFSLKDLCGKQTHVHFVGGEPLMKRGIIDIIRFSSQNKFISSMTTNGFLIDKDMALRIAGSGLDTLVLSLDSLNPRTHDYLRGVPGVYNKVMDAIGYFEAIAAEKPRIHVVTTIMASNIKELADLALWAQDKKEVANISFQAVMQPFFTPGQGAWYNDEAFSFLWPKDQNELNRSLDELIKLKKSGLKITNASSQFEVFRSYFSSPENFIKKGACNLGVDSLTVNSSGKMFFCLDKEPIGDIRKDDVKKAWFSDKAESVRQQIKSCKKNCKLMVNCFFKEE
ncbi:MAG: radical SAM protein [Candidatus Omnitrophica bacterium]|nr:radical SAM protein [Candidatus Omnitrophota bacterium]MDD5552700.1 radical SAM protein [Candidatus Omnitrophota bacterium]